ncbi:MAG: endonuclease/exonuclease/phosphatase family protein [Anaerolineae bacterium]
MQRHELLGTVETVAILVFFLQAIRALFSLLFGVIYDALFVGPFTLSAVAIIVLTFLAFLSPLGAPRGGPRWLPLAAGVAVLLARIPLTLDHPPVRLASSLVIVACASLYLAATLPRRPGRGVHGLILALAVEQLLRAGGNTFDPSLRSGWMTGQAAVSAALVALSAWYHRSLAGFVRTPAGQVNAAGGLAWGAFLFLETSLLALPNAVARWTGTDYSLVAPLVLLVTLLPLLPGTRLLTQKPEKGKNWTWGAGRAALALAGLALGHFLRGGVGLLGLLAAQGLLVAAQDGVVSEGRGRNRTGVWLALGWLVFVVFNFAYAFAFTYAYTLDLFRGAGLPILLAAGLVAALPGVRPGPSGEAEASLRTRAMAWTGAVLAAGICLLLALPPHPSLKEVPTTLRVATYNIHYGYNSHWNFTLEAIARTLEESGVDVVFLQEVDAGRITSYSVDDALWLERRLGMQAVYQPTVEHLTGIGLLSRVPLVSGEGKLLTSRAEQTAIVGAQLRTAGGSLNAYGIWLGISPEERAVQLEEALAFIQSREGPAVFGGDFNAAPDSPVYARIQASGFVDPFVALGLEPRPTSPAEGPHERIDFVWVRGLQPTGAWVSDSLASDHRLVVVEVRAD